MDKEEILEKSQLENQGRDMADLDAQRHGAWVGYLLGVLGIILVDLVNGLVLHQVNRGPDMVLCLMASAAFFVKYRHLRKRHELIVAVCYGILAMMFGVFWVFQLRGTW